jgi:DUF1365 family protein
MGNSWSMLKLSGLAVSWILGLTKKEDVQIIGLSLLVGRVAADVSEHLSGLGSSFLKATAYSCIVTYCVANKLYPLYLCLCQKPTLTQAENADVFGNGCGKALFFPLQTMHTRLYPKSHSFRKRYFWAGVPIALKSANPAEQAPHSESRGGLLSIDDTTSSTRSVFRVDGVDYLKPNMSGDTLPLRLIEHFKTIKIPAEPFAFAYLLTMPKLAGYTFNPLSIWYLYSEDMYLSALLLEVNNTFGQRTIYFLEQKPQNKVRSTSLPRPSSPKALKVTKQRSQSLPNKARSAKDGTFHAVWDKTMFVSPFSDASGTYTIMTTDPFANATAPWINAVIKLSDDGHLKVVASVKSTDPAINPLELSTWEKFKFALKWAPVCWATEPRTWWQAKKLWWDKGLSVYERPRSEHEQVTDGGFVITAIAMVVRFLIAALVHQDWKAENASIWWSIACAAWMLWPTSKA